VSRKRAHIGLKTKLAAAIGALFLTYEERTKLSEDQVLSLVQWDHDPIPHAHDGADSHENIVPVLIPGHRIKTATKDVPTIAKVKRIGKAEQEFRQRLLAPRDERPERKSSFPKGRKLQSNTRFVKKDQRRK
jgi:hypothetical protein